MIQFPKPTVEQFFRTYTITNFTVNDAEDRLVFSTNLNGTMNLWAMDLPNSFPYLFAQQDESCNFIKFDPENRHVLAGFDRDGDENYHIYAIPIDGGVPRPFVSGEAKEKYFLSHLSEDGMRLYYMTSEENPSYLNVRVRDVEDNSDVLLHKGEVSPTGLGAVSADEQAFVYLRMFSNTYITGFAKAGDETYDLTPDDEHIHIVSDPIFTDDRTIHFLTNYHSDHSYLASFHLDTGEFSKVIEIKGESMHTLKWNKENKVFYFVTGKGVIDVLYRYDMDTRSLHKCTAPVDCIEQVDVAKTGNLYLLGRSATVPHNLFQSEDGHKWKQLTNNRVLGLRREELVEPETVFYTSFDGMEIEALLFQAHPEYDNGYTIFWPHGGPQAAERKSFRSMFQAFLNRGYTIFAPNFRGSSGYGTSFIKLVEQDWGYGPRLDCVAGVEWLFNNGITERDNLFLVGGSYGGYMALLLHGRHPEYFRAVVDIFGPSNLFTFVNSVPDHWKPLMKRWVGDPQRDRQRFINDSPITYLEAMSKPMLVIQGAKDPRVVKEESDQIVAKLKEKGRDVEYLLLEDEGHGFSKKENEINVYMRVLDFLEKHQQ